MAITLTRGIGALSASAIMLLTGCASSDDGSTDGASATTTVADDSSFTVDPSASPSAKQDDDADDTGEATGSPTANAGAAGGEAALAAIATAAASQTDGKVYDVELDDDDDQRWEIKVASSGQGHKVYVSLDGATVISQEPDDDDNDDIQAIEKAAVDAATALQTALDAKGGSLDEMEIDEDDGTLKWDIELDIDGQDVEADVDATSGELLN
ncbi:PepSY domain-containing protein [Blastococcus sp. Marseille-P5729]|uniref:PepSY domain-containing protein n=1 Tax=Blastococcus sp. Marseille-P5729 TaxID=2086582 RepID=UPI000D10C6A5|nr:PepSY domain-containing protein [Blastococcus sp. Marseille-P5729]